MDRPSTIVVIIMLTLLIPISYGDPIQNIFRDIVLSVRSAGERILASLPISQPFSVMYQMDPKTSLALNSIGELINRLSMGAPAYMPKTVGDFMRQGEAPHCLQIAVLADPFPTPFEWSFTSSAGKRSIVGQLSSEDGRHLTFSFGADVELRTTLVYASPTDDILVLADLDSVPKCSNIMVLRRNQSLEGRLLPQLASQGMTPPSNPLLPISCP